MVLKCYNFLWVQRRHNCSPEASFANCVMTLYLLKVHLQNVSFYINNSKMPNFELWHSCRKWGICYLYRILCYILPKLSMTYMKTLPTSYTNTYGSTYFTILIYINTVGHATTNSSYQQNQDATTKSFFINKIRMLQWTWRNTIGRRSSRTCTTCWAFALWLERQSSSLILLVRSSYQFSSVIKESLFIVFTTKGCLCFSNLHVHCIKVKLINFMVFFHFYFLFCIIFFLFK
jgi:frataxin-like iron-binding protein CyaY